MVTQNAADDENALVCVSDVETAPRDANWYLHPTQLSTEEGDRIQSYDHQGWARNRGINSAGHRLVRLKRHYTITAEEGVFTCHVVGDSNTPISVGIYYPSELILLVAIIMLLKVHLHVPYMSLFYSIYSISVAISLVQDVGEYTFSVLHQLKSVWMIVYLDTSTPSLYSTS